MLFLRAVTPYRLSQVDTIVSKKHTVSIFRAEWRPVDTSVTMLAKFWVGSEVLVQTDGVWWRGWTLHLKCLGAQENGARVAKDLIGWLLVRLTRCRNCMGYIASNWRMVMNTDDCLKGESCGSCVVRWCATMCRDARKKRNSSVRIAGRRIKSRARDLPNATDC
jgi:hypothetical protein